MCFFDMCAVCECPFFFVHLSGTFGRACDSVDCPCGQVKGRHAVLLGLRLEGNTEWKRAKFSILSLPFVPCVCALYHAASAAEMNWLFLSARAQLCTAQNTH